MAAENILIVEDEELMRSILRQLIEGSGYRACTADSTETALEVYSGNDIDLTLTDIKMAGEDGLALLDHIKSREDDAMVIIMTAFSSVDTAVAALRKGAYDYITKPFVNEDLLQTVKNALAHRRLFRENRVLRRELVRRGHYPDIIGASKSLGQVLELVEKVAPTTASVLIQGESGTGKELIARAIHFSSDRSDKPFLAVNCGALPESLLESELFGHVKGAFTGAVSDRAGFFRAASGGTLFLDEVGDMPAALQVKLLRALQEHEVTPVGASASERFDARIITATNRKLETEINAGKFREDLYYRLNVVEIEVPPLRERPDDIAPLVEHFVNKSAQNRSEPSKGVSTEALEALKNYSWPGNIRELEHAIERAMILSDDEIGIDSLPDKISGEATRLSGQGPKSPIATLDEVEQQYIQEILASLDQDKAAAAKLLGIDLSTLYRKLKRYELA